MTLEYSPEKKKVYGSDWDSVETYVWGDVWESVRESVRESVWDSVWEPVLDSVDDYVVEDLK